LKFITKKTKAKAGVVGENKQKLPLLPAVF